ncbi:hypothetical protein EPN96_03070 [bacterium]|nr:MAG: hypothetical protein EPN96_03070 [bacterium]
MQCKDIEALWVARLDGAVSADLESEMGVHIDGCERCRKFVASMEKLEYALEVIGDEKPEAPPFLKARIMARLEEERAPLGSRIFGWLTAPRLIAASLVAIAFFGGLATREMMLRSPLKDSLAMQKVAFEFEAPNASNVSLVGDFNDWGLRDVPISANQSGGRWVFEVKLVPGRYQYAFVVDGKKWLPDPKAAGIIPDGFGGQNSVLYIQGGQKPTLL